MGILPSTRDYLKKETIETHENYKGNNIGDGL